MVCKGIVIIANGINTYSSSVPGESVDDFLVELSEEEKALLTAEVVKRLSQFLPLALVHIPKCLRTFPMVPIWDEDPDYPEVMSILGAILCGTWN